MGETWRDPLSPCETFHCTVEGIKIEKSVCPQQFCPEVSLHNCNTLTILAYRHTDTGLKFSLTLPELCIPRNTVFGMSIIAAIHVCGLFILFFLF